MRLGRVREPVQILLAAEVVRDHELRGGGAVGRVEPVAAAEEAPALGVALEFADHGLEVGAEGGEARGVYAEWAFFVASG